MATPGIQLTVINFNDRVLQQNIVQMSRATGRTVIEETRTVFKGMVRDALLYTPPGSQGATGKDAQRAGEAAISRDLNDMGFVPKNIKGHRTITMAFGRPIKPVTVPTKENPQFADPDGFHAARIAASQKVGRRGRVSRGGRQAFYVSKAKFNAMVKRLFAEIGLLASGWVPAAETLGVPVPAWIARHAASGRGSNVEVLETGNKITMRVVNHVPATAETIAGEILVVGQFR